MARRLMVLTLSLKNLKPIVDIELLDGNGNRERTSVIVDTGFNGYLCLSENLIGDLV